MSENLGTNQIERRAGPFCITETWHAPHLVLAAHEHEKACLHFVLAGCYHETSAGGSQPFGPGTVLYKPGGVRHSNRFPECGARTLRVEVDPGFAALLGEPARRPRQGCHSGLELIARRLHAELVQGDDLSPLAMEGLVRELLAGLFRQDRPTRTGLRLAEKCAELLRQRFHEPLRLGGLATELHCDRSGLARAFRLRFGRSMGEFVRELRVAEVMRLLERGEKLAEIALQVGFADQSHCTRVFRRLTGVPPATWSRSTRMPGIRRRTSGFRAQR